MDAQLSGQYFFPSNHTPKKIVNFRATLNRQAHRWPWVLQNFHLSVAVEVNIWLAIVVRGPVQIIAIGRDSTRTLAQEISNKPIHNTFVAKNFVLTRNPLLLQPGYFSSIYPKISDPRD
jgi:hypothetical protein